VTKKKEKPITLNFYTDHIDFSGNIDNVDIENPYHLLALAIFLCLRDGNDDFFDVIFKIIDDFGASE